MKTKKWINSPWTIGLSSAILPVVLTIITDYFKRVPILTTIKSVLETLLNLFLSILNIELRVWWLLIALILMVSILYLIIRIKQVKIIAPEFTKYKEDRFKKWRWTWNWEYNSYRKGWEIMHLTAHCPKCETELINNSNLITPIFECPRCEFKAINSQCEEPRHIEVLIHDNIKKKNLKIDYI